MSGRWQTQHHVRNGSKAAGRLRLGSGHTESCAARVRASPFSGEPEPGKRANQHQDRPYHYQRWSLLDPVPDPVRCPPVGLGSKRCQPVSDERESKTRDDQPVQPSHLNASAHEANLTGDACVRYGSGADRRLTVESGR